MFSFAGVKFPKVCPGHKDTAVINVSGIISKFDASNYSTKKLYNVKCSKNPTGKCAALIIFLTKTKEEAVKKIQSQRLKYPPMSKVYPPSSSEDSEAGKRSTHGPKLSSNSNLPANFIQTKVQNLRAKYALKEARPKEPAPQRVNSPAVKLSLKRKLAEPTDKIEEPSTSATKKNLSQRYNQDDGEKSEASEDSDNTRQSDCNSDLETSDDEHQRKLQAKVKRLENELILQDQRIVKLTRRNDSLQDLLVSRLQEVHKNIDDIEKESANANGKDTFTKIGAINGNKIHLGRNVWISKDQYDAIVLTAKSHSMFIKGLAKACFGIKELINSSVFGKASNRIKKTNPEPPRPRLDPRIILAIQDSVEDWAKKSTPPYNAIDIQGFVSSTGTILSKYITQLRHLAHSKKSRETSVALIGNNEDDPAGDDTSTADAENNNDTGNSTLHTTEFLDLPNNIAANDATTSPPTKDLSKQKRHDGSMTVKPAVADGTYDDPEENTSSEEDLPTNEENESPDISQTCAEDVFIG